MPVFILILLLMCPCWSAHYALAQQSPLHGHVTETWTIETAREHVFAYALPVLDVSQFPATDVDYAVNAPLVHLGGGQFGSRLITVFDHGGYAVTERCSLWGYYYSAQGQLIMVQHASSPAFADDSCEAIYPIKTYKHAVYGEQPGALTGLSLKVSPTQAFEYAPNGAFEAQWHNTDCTRADGSFCGTRSSFVQASPAGDGL
jgi:hypothetical protein